MVRHSLRWLLIVSVAVCAALGIVFVAIASMGDRDDAQVLAAAYCGEAQRRVAVAIARATPLGPSQEDYRVYSAVIELMNSGNTGKPPILLMTEWPAEARPVPERGGGCFTNVWPSAAAVEDFKANNRFQWGLSRRFQVSEPLQFVRPIDLAWPIVGSHVEHVAFSRVGYDVNHGVALVYVAHHCPLCGSGSYVVVKRDDSRRWAVAGRCLVWAS